MRANSITRARKVTALVLALLAVAVTERLIGHDILSRVNSIEIVLEREGPAEVRIYYQHSPASRTFDEHRLVKTSVVLDGKQRITTRLHDNKAVLFLFEFDLNAATPILREIIFKSHYASPVRLKGTELAAYFAPGNELTRIKSTEKGLKIHAEPGAAALVSTRKITFHNPYIRFGFPALIGVLLFFLVLRFTSGSIPSLAQLDAYNAGIKPHTFELDGLRGLAALSVVADHTWGIFSGSGLAGVWIFFALSGYLLAIPFVRRPQLAFDKTRLRDYLFRRLARILPMYYTTVFVYYLASGEVQWALPHFLFLQGDGQLWTIPQEMFFYLLLPFVMFGMAGLLRIHFNIALIVLTALTLWLLWNDLAIPIRMNSRPDLHPPFMGWFLVGICVSFILNHEHSAAVLNKVQHKLVKPLGWIACVVLVGIFVIGSATILSGLLGHKLFPAYEYRTWFGIAAGFLVFTAVYARNSVYGAILRFKPLRSFGIIGYSAYLLHPLLIDILRKLSGFYIGLDLTGVQLFVLTTLVTWFVASFTYNLIEYPFLKKKSRPSKQTE